MTKNESSDPILSYDEIAEALVAGQPVVSPDGSRVAFEVRSRSATKKTPETAIWLSRDGEPARRFTGGKANDTNPSWSPDGTRLAFLSNREDAKKTAIYLLPFNGGEAQRLGDLDGSLSSLTWSPDGSTLGVLRVDPETEQEEQRKKDKNDPQVFEEDAKLTRLWLVNAESGKARTLTTASRNVWNYGWHPGTKGLVYTSTPINTMNSLFVSATLWHIPAAGGLSKQIATFSPAPDSPIVRSDNGQDVVVLAASILRDDPTPSVWKVPLAGGTPEDLLPGFDGAVSSVVADRGTPDRFYVHAVEGVHDRWFAMSAKETGATPLDLAGLDGGSMSSSPAVSDDGTMMAAIWSRSDRYPEVWLASGSKQATAITSFGESFSGRLHPGEIVRWNAADGVEIEGILLRPRDHEAGNPLPLFVQIHGGPSWQWEDRLNMSWHDWGQMLASRGWAVLLPNPRGSTGRGSDFEKLLFGDVGGGECTDLIAGVEAIVERGIADPERLAIGGWSWGGYLTARTITQTGMFKAAVMGAGVANLVSDHAAGDIAEANMAYYPGHPYTHWDMYADRSPVRDAANVTTPTLILHGAADSRVHPTQGQEFHRALQVTGVPVRFVLYPREGHGFQERHHQVDLMKRIVEWLETYVPEP